MYVLSSSNTKTANIFEYFSLLVTVSLALELMLAVNHLWTTMTSGITSQFTFPRITDTLFTTSLHRRIKRSVICVLNDLTLTTEV